MDFLNKPMSEVWRATKRTFNEIMEINNTDLSDSASGNLGRPESEPSMNQRRYTTHGKTTSLPRLQRPRESLNIDDFHIVSGDSDGSLDFETVAGGPSSWNGTEAADAHVSRSRESRSPEDEGSGSSFLPRNRYRSNSSDRASMRNRNEDVMVNRLYQRSTSYDKAMENDIDDEEEEDQADKMKTKLMSMWNNMKYGWTVKSKTAFSLQKPIWFLGKCYQHRPSDPEPISHPGMESVKSPQMELFKQDFTTRLWMTYRRDFPAIDGSTLTTDCGWGCMLRSGQMLLAQCLVTHFLGRDWNIYKQQTEEQDKYHHEVIRWFGDQPNDMSPFSIHRLINVGKHSGKKAGDWYGPSSVAHILRDAMETAPDLNPLFEQVCIYVAQDCTVYKQDVIDLCRNRYQGSPKPTYKDRPPTPHVSKRIDTQHQNTPDNHPSQHSSVQSSCETLINGNHSEESSQNASHSANMNQRSGNEMHDGTVSNNAIPQKQPMYSPRADRTVTHNAFGYSTSENSTRYHRSQSSCANTSLSPSAIARDKRTKSESDARNVHHLSETVEHPICRRNAVKELKQGTGWSGTYNRSELKSPVRLESKLSWAEARTKSNISSHGASEQGPDSHNEHEQPSNSHNAFSAARDSHYNAFASARCTRNASASDQGSHNASASHNSSSHGNHAYNSNISGHRNHSHHASGHELRSHNVSGHKINSHIPPVHEQNVPSQSTFEHRQEQLPYKSSGYPDLLSQYGEADQNRQPLSKSQPNLKTDPWQKQTHKTLENGHDWTSKNPTLPDEPVWKRKSADLQHVKQLPRNDLKQRSDLHHTKELPRNNLRQRSDLQHTKQLPGSDLSQRSDLQYTKQLTKSDPKQFSDLQHTKELPRNNLRQRSDFQHTKQLPGSDLSQRSDLQHTKQLTKSDPKQFSDLQHTKQLPRSDLKQRSDLQHTKQLTKSDPKPFSDLQHTKQLPRSDLKQQSELQPEKQLPTPGLRQPSKETEINGVCSDTGHEHTATGAATDETTAACAKENDAEIPKEKKWCALILMVPVRLGGDDVNPIYVNPLRSLFTLESCMGIIGGKPKHSLYYVGFQDEKMIHLDPHYCQAVVDMKSRTFPTYSFHCMSPRKMRITNMDPSCTVGFYLKTEEDFEEFCKTIPEVITPAQSGGDYPMFIVRDGHCSDWHENGYDSDNKKDRFLRIRHIDEDGRLLAPMKESEDFVFLES